MKIEASWKISDLLLITERQKIKACLHWRYAKQQPPSKKLSMQNKKIFYSQGHESFIYNKLHSCQWNRALRGTVNQQRQSQPAGSRQNAQCTHEICTSSLHLQPPHSPTLAAEQGCCPPSLTRQSKREGKRKKSSAITATGRLKKTGGENRWIQFSSHSEILHMPQLVKVHMKIGAKGSPYLMQNTRDKPPG